MEGAEGTHSLFFWLFFVFFFEGECLVGFSGVFAVAAVVALGVL